MHVQSRGHKVLYTPPHYSWWQPIELYWASVKNAIARRYTGDRTLQQTGDQLCEEIQRFGSPEHCAKYVNHCASKIIAAASAMDEEDASDGALIEQTIEDADSDDDEGKSLSSESSSYFSTSSENNK